MSINNQFQAIIKNSRHFEELIINKSGLQANKDFVINDISISNCLSQNETIHTIFCKSQTGKQSQNQNNFVCVHGYFGVAASYYKMIKALSYKSNVYSIDLPGRGLSSRPRFKLQNPKEIIDYYIDSLESWRKANKINKLQLIGHSFGGYISGNYALKYPMNVEKLHLISPIGVTNYQQSKVNRKDIFKKAALMAVGQLLYNYELTLSELYQIRYLPTEQFLKVYMKYIFMDRENIDLWTSYYKYILQLQESGETSFYKLFQLPELQAVLPLESRFSSQTFQIPTYFYFGDHDWMNIQGASRLSNQLLKQNQFKLHIISKSSHNINFDNASELTQIILSNSFE